MSAAERLYRLLLRAYPPAFRAEYGREMVLLFRDQCREDDMRSLRFWAAVIWDVARSAPVLRAEAWGARGSESTRTLEVIMKLAAMLTVLLGVFVILNAVGEAVPGSRGTMEGAYIVAVALAALAGALILTAGVALQRGAPSARKTASAAALASLVFIVVARLLHPWMSILSLLVGIGVPVALLIVLQWTRKRPAAGALLFLLAFSVPASHASAQQPQDTTKGGPAVKDVPLAAAQRQSYLGNYTANMPQGGEVSVRVFEENGVLKMWVSDPGDARRLIYQGNNVFVPENTPDFVIAFVTEGGRITGFNVRKEDGWIVAVRSH
jgi:hypothetical protein